jgi:hypothetical protein
MQTQGKRDPEKVAQAERAEKRKQAHAKKPAKDVKTLTKAERDAAIDAMLEWWINQE